MTRTRLTSYLLLHGLFFLYSFVGICYKYVSKAEFLSLAFFGFLGLAFFLLFIYAILWQQILKRVPLTAAFSNKGVVVMWGMLWGVLFFHERITIFMLIGAVLICAGIVLVTRDE
ncbi:MAG: EamA family transporter [Peptococcaceae bacterium]|nr:EamA family transporter [Peptococcaceae bacterium]